MAKKSITDSIDVEVSLDSLIQKFGESIVSAEERVEAISTGSLALDASIGVGGIPRGRFTEAYGAEGSGKTTVGLSTAKQCLNTRGKVLYIDAELMLDYDTIEAMMGEPFDPSKFILVHPDTAEEALMTAETLINKGQIDLVVVDTVAALLPKAEKDKELNEYTVAEISRLLPKFFRKDSILVKRNNVAFLFLNQVRDKVGSYTQGYNTPGGHALKHHSSVIISLTKAGETKIGADSVGVKSKFVIKKNKLAPPFRSFTIPITFGKGIDYFVDVLEFCEMLGVVQKGGSYYKFEGETIGQGKFAAGDYLRDNPDVLAKIIEQTYTVLKGNKGVNIVEDGFAEETALDLE